MIDFPKEIFMTYCEIIYNDNTFMIYVLSRFFHWKVSVNVTIEVINNSFHFKSQSMLGWSQW